MTAKDRFKRVRALRYGLRCISSMGVEPGKAEDIAVLTDMLHHEHRLLMIAVRDEDLEPLPDARTPLSSE